MRASRGGDVHRGDDATTRCGGSRPPPPRPRQRLKQTRGRLPTLPAVDLWSRPGGMAYGSTCLAYCCCCCCCPTATRSRHQTATRLWQRLAASYCKAAQSSHAPSAKAASSALRARSGRPAAPRRKRWRTAPRRLRHRRHHLRLRRLRHPRRRRPVMRPWRRHAGPPSQSVRHGRAPAAKCA
jgi:hypothetical protein